MGTALVYDEEMTRYKLLWVDPTCKIEVPERLTVSHEALVGSGLADRCVSIPVREATDAEILLVHSEEYLEAVKRTPHMSLEDLMEFTLQYGDVYFHPNIYHCARLAAGAAMQLVDGVVMGKMKNGMALVRPPGHHSQRSAANGFCVFNNVAIAARYAQQKYNIKRVLIVDWDVHHGQGVQYCFEDDPSVLYFSWHRYEHQKFWPNLRESDYDSVGKEGGAGFTINVPWNKVGMTNSDYLSVFCHLLLPVAYEFCPELVLVCAGFDSAIGDPEGEMCATPDVFAHLTHLLMNLAGGKLCVVLEGGYNLTSLPQSVCHTVHTLLGDPIPRPVNLSGPCTSALESLQCVRSAHKPYWSCLGHAADLPPSDISTKHVKLSGEREQSTKEEMVWPVHPQPVVCSVRTAALLPDDTVCPDGCRPFSSSEILNFPTVSKLREKFLSDGADLNVLSTLSSLILLTDKIQNNEISSGLALVPDVSTAVTCVVQHVTVSPSSRVLIVCVGDENISSHITDNGRSLVMLFNSREMEQQMSRFYVPVFLKKGCSDVAGVLQAVLGLLLPLGYEFDPSFVLLVRPSGCGLSDILWQQLTGLLQCFALGHTLVLIQEDEKACVGLTGSALLGFPAPSLEVCNAPLLENLEVVEGLRCRLQTDWKLLQTTAPEPDESAEPRGHPASTSNICL
ncbi:polyamine deacetylase HDAC10 isoform X2 [Gouania willdenowi]|uniref:Histone deacetylase domain-containing protein n=1 Tax=Gouania willdenowi TaxID=441366 RepID=A0A8C5GWN5_GOUWI|nr:polyamine deacetylase HDAC10 isoform X2 [Gouania willdenowi]